LKRNEIRAISKGNGSGLPLPLWEGDYAGLDLLGALFQTLGPVLPIVAALFVFAIVVGALNPANAQGLTGREGFPVYRWQEGNVA
jgi:hypothetical protein